MPAIVVRIPLPMRKLTGDLGTVEAVGLTVAELVDDLERRYPGVRAKLLNDEGRLHRYMNIYLNGDDIRYRESLNTTVAEGDVIQIIPAAAGGSD